MGGAHAVPPAACTKVILHSTCHPAVLFHTTFFFHAAGAYAAAVAGGGLGDVSNSVARSDARSVQKAQVAGKGRVLA